MSWRGVGLIVIGAMASMAFVVSSRAGASTATTMLVSASSVGVQGDGFSGRPSISADGRFVTFESYASNLVSGDTNAEADVFLHDVASGTTTRVSVSSNGVQGDGFSGRPSISADGRFVTFESYASNLVSGDTNAKSDVFLHDVASGTTTRVSVSSGGVQGDGFSFLGSISATGRFVSFNSDSSNLVVADTNVRDDIFVYDRRNGTTERVSVDSAGVQGDWNSAFSSISANGRFVAFLSGATNLVVADTNASDDIFVHDRRNGTTERVSVSSSGRQANFESANPSISADGGSVAFESDATNLIPDDGIGHREIFVHNLVNGKTKVVSVDSQGEFGIGVHGRGNCYDPSISAHGRFVVFETKARGLVAGDTNRTSDVFMHDRRSGRTKRVSLSSLGVQGNGASGAPSISGDGQFVAFTSSASNLVLGDTNSKADVFVRGSRT